MAAAINVCGGIRGRHQGAVQAINACCGKLLTTIGWSFLLPLNIEPQRAEGKIEDDNGGALSSVQPVRGHVTSGGPAHV